MSGYIADFLTLLGLVATVLGAGVAARAVILTEDDAISIGVSRLSGSREENLKLPMVQNLLSSSRWAKWGLLAIFFGTLFSALRLYIDFSFKLRGLQ